MSERNDQNSPGKKSNREVNEKSEKDKIQEIKNLQEIHKETTAILVNLIEVQRKTIIALKKVNPLTCLTIVR